MLADFFRLARLYEYFQPSFFLGLRRMFSACCFGILFLSSQATWAEPLGRLLVLGNSITWRTPNADLGWYGNWGMAASSQANDFSHVLALLLEKSQGGQKLVIYPRNVSDFERFPESFDFSRLSFVDSFRPDAVVVFLGDNVNKNTIDLPMFEKKYQHLLSSLNGGFNRKIYCVSTWWVIEKVDGVISKSCLAKGGTFVDIKGISNLPGMKADSLGKFSNPGVAAHPSDEGMAAIAKQIFRAMNGGEK